MRERCQRTLIRDKKELKVTVVHYRVKLLSSLDYSSLRLEYLFCSAGICLPVWNRFLYELPGGIPPGAQLKGTGESHGFDI
jgi:hypothetical protein